MPPVPRPLTARRLVHGLVLSAIVLSRVAASCAEEQVIEFLHAAQDQGYGEVAVDYLNRLQSQGTLPKELADTFDLELSRSYRVAVAEAFNAAEAEQRLAKAQTHLDKFLKEHPDHPEVARAMESWGDIGLDRGLQRIRLAAATKDKAQKEKHLAAARADFELARPRFVDATTRYLAQFTKLKGALAADGNKRPKSAATLTKKQRQAEDAVRDSEVAWLDCRFKSAKIDFYLGQTFADEKSPERKAALEAAAKAFDDVFQGYRESLVGLHAHMWHGRVADQLRKDQLALDIYDEVLATSPDGIERETGLEPLFAQVQYHRLLVVERTQGAKELLTQATPWLDRHRTWKKFDGYQGVALEAAKANLKLASELKGDKKAALTQSSLAALTAIAKVRGEHQQEAILLRREHTKSGSQDPQSAKTFDEALALADAAAENLDWSAAAVMLARALELGTSPADQKQVPAVQARLEQARYQLAAASYAAGKLDECLALAEQIVRDRPDGPVAPTAASLAIATTLSLYAKAQDKPAALERLTAIANDTIRRWPDKAEADDARIALGQASLVRGDLPAAVAVFDAVNPRSLRYPVAMFLAGQTHWRLYLAAKAKGQSDRESPTAERAKAEEQLRLSLAAQRKDAEPGKPLARQMLDTQLLLSELCLEAGQVKEAGELIEPLVQWVQAEKPAPLDNTALRIFLSAVRAQTGLGDMPKAAATTGLLLELGQDNAAVNGVLNSVLRLFVEQWKQAEADAIEARTGADPTRQAAATAAAAACKDLLAKFVARVAGHKEHTLPAMITIADTCAIGPNRHGARTLPGHSCAVRKGSRV